MNYWRLVTHHINPKIALARYWRDEFIALGWGAIGDLRVLHPLNSDGIKAAILGVNRTMPNYADKRSAAEGARCLWGFYREMKEGDIVILSLGKEGGPQKETMEVKENYSWTPTPVFPGTPINADYQHLYNTKRRPDLNGQVLWRTLSLAPTWNPRWALCRLIPKLSS